MVGLNRIGENQCGTVHYRVWNGVQGDPEGYSEMDIHRVILRNQNTDSQRSAQDTIELSESHSAKKLVASEPPIDKYISDPPVEEDSGDTNELSSGFTLKLRPEPGFYGNKWYDNRGNPLTDNARRILAERDAAGSKDAIRVLKHTLTNNFQHREIKRLFKTQELQKRNDTNSDKDDSALECSYCGRSTIKIQCYHRFTARPLCHTCYHYRWRHGICRPCVPGMLSDLSVKNDGQSAENTNQRPTEPVSYETIDDSTEEEKEDILVGPRIKRNAMQEAPSSVEAKLFLEKGEFPLRERGSSTSLRSSTASKLAQPAAQNF